jgi:hypothetical protein
MMSQLLQTMSAVTISGQNHFIPPILGDAHFLTKCRVDGWSDGAQNRVHVLVPVSGLR